MSYQNNLKSYKSYDLPNKFGIKCTINCPEGIYPLHRHDYFEFEYINKGEIIHEINGEIFHLKSGDIYMLSPNDLHLINVISPVEIHNICINVKECSAVLQKLVSSAAYPRTSVLHNEKLTEINELFYKIIEAENNNGLYLYERINAYALLMISEFLTLPTTKLTPSSKNGYRYITKAMEYIEKNITTSPSLDEVAEFVGISSNYFSKLFSTVCGKTFIEYINDEKIKYAKTLLTSEDFSITDIAFASGFGSFSAFSRSFKKICGCTPYEYKKQTNP